MNSALLPATREIPESSTFQAKRVDHETGLLFDPERQIALVAAVGRLVTDEG